MSQRSFTQSAAFERAEDGRADGRGPAPAILVVDDDPSIVDTLRLLLLGEGYTVRTAADSYAALAIVRQDRVDLIICDVAMPFIDGRELVQRLRAEGVRTPAILMSAFSSVEPLDGVPFIAKPFDIDHLLHLVASRLPNAATDC